MEFSKIKSLENNFNSIFRSIWTIAVTTLLASAKDYNYCLLILLHWQSAQIVKLASIWLIVFLGVWEMIIIWRCWRKMDQVMMKRNMTEREKGSKKRLQNVKNYYYCIYWIETFHKCSLLLNLLGRVRKITLNGFRGYGLFCTWNTKFKICMQVDIF